MAGHHRHLNSQEKQRLTELAAYNTVQEIAARLRLHQDTVRYTLRKLGVRAVGQHKKAGVE